MDAESKRIIAKAARDHAKYEAQYAGLVSLFLAIFFFFFSVAAVGLGLSSL